MYFRYQKPKLIFTCMLNILVICFVLARLTDYCPIIRSDIQPFSDDLNQWLF